MLSVRTSHRKTGAVHVSSGAFKTRLLDELMHIPGWFVVVTNEHFELQLANEYFFRYFECDAADLTGKMLYDFLGDEKHNDMNPAHIQRILTDGSVCDYYAHTTRADGEPVVIRWNQTAFCDAQGHEVILSVGVVHTADPPVAGEPDPLHRAQDVWQDFPLASAFWSGIRAIDEEAGLYPVTDMQTAVKQALSERAFTLYYQPSVSTRTRRIVGVEALVRMNHPDYGVIPARRFIQRAEETGQIIAIGEFVINAACKKLKQWTDLGLDLFLAVNISAGQFIHEAFPETLLHAMTRYDVQSNRLMLEITDAAIAQNPQKVLNVLEVLHGMGCRISMDNFGAGFSSLHYLERLEIDNLKIDKTFFLSTPDNRKSFAVIESMIVLAHGLGMTVTAEGVETRTQFDFLQDKSCDYIQGYFLGRSMPETDIDRLVRSDPLF